MHWNTEERHLSKLVQIHCLCVEGDWSTTLALRTYSNSSEMLHLLYKYSLLPCCILLVCWVFEFLGAFLNFRIFSTSFVFILSLSVFNCYFFHWFFLRGCVLGKIWCVVEGICNFIPSVQVSIPSTPLYSFIHLNFFCEMVVLIFSLGHFPGKKHVIINNEVASGKLYIVHVGHSLIVFSL